MKYHYYNSWTDDRIDVSGCIVGTDGSGGKHGRQIRTRKCGFGVSIVKLCRDGTFQLVGSAFGSVPGKQTVPRSEMAGLLHALLHTKGDAIMECDNRAVWRIFSRGRAQPEHNVFYGIVFFGLGSNA